MLLEANMSASKLGKYTPEILLPALRLFVEARRKALIAGFTDNGGAIHSIERIVDILAQRVRYPAIRHIQAIKGSNYCRYSQRAAELRNERSQLYIEHVQPQRAFAQRICALIEEAAPDDDVIAFIKTNYELVVLTKEEARALDKINRTKISEDRLQCAGLIMVEPHW